MPKRLNGYFQSEKNARLAIIKLKLEDGFGEIDLDKILTPKEQRVNQMTNAYSGDMPYFARGTLGSDIALQGKSYDGLYDEEVAREVERDKKELGELVTKENIWRVTCVATQEERFKRFEQLIEETNGVVNNSESADR